MSTLLLKVRLLFLKIMLVVLNLNNFNFRLSYENNLIPYCCGRKNKVEQCDCLRHVKKTNLNSV